MEQQHGGTPREVVRGDHGFLYDAKWLRHRDPKTVTMREAYLWWLMAQMATRVCSRATTWPTRLKAHDILTEISRQTGIPPMAKMLELGSLLEAYGEAMAGEGGKLPELDPTPKPLPTEYNVQMKGASIDRIQESLCSTGLANKTSLETMRQVRDIIDSLAWHTGRYPARYKRLVSRIKESE